MTSAGYGARHCYLCTHACIQVYNTRTSQAKVKPKYGVHISQIVCVEVFVIADVHATLCSTSW